MEWQPIETNPKSGEPFWGYLYDTGIHELRWMSAEETSEYFGCAVDECEGGFVKPDDPSQDWKPRWWLPKDAFPAPPER